MPTTSEEMSMISAATTVIVHPLVLLSVTDHASRVSLSARKRCVGVLLGQDNGKSVNVANSFAVPFEEDENDPKTLFSTMTILRACSRCSRKSTPVRR